MVDGTPLLIQRITRRNTVQKITPCLWFDHDAEEAVNHYLSIFKNSKIVGVTAKPDKKSTADRRDRS